MSTDITHRNCHPEMLALYFLLRDLSNIIILLSQLTIVVHELENKYIHESTVSHVTNPIRGIYCSINLFIILHRYLFYANIAQTIHVIHVYTYTIIANNVCPIICLIFNYPTTITPCFSKPYMYARKPILFTINMFSERFKYYLSAVLLFAVHVIIMIFTTICSINIRFYLCSNYVSHARVEIIHVHGVESFEGSNNNNVQQ